MTSKDVKKIKILLLLILITVLIGCGKDEKNKETDTLSATEYRWEDVTAKARGKSVNMYMWGSDNDINRYIDEVVEPELMKLNDVAINRVPVLDIADTVNRLIVEKHSKIYDSDVDIMWINGNNFRVLKRAGLLWGDFFSGMPSSKDIKTSATQNDFGESVDGLEAPWGEAQFSFVGRKAAYFTDHKSLKKYVKTNKGKFTYPAVPDFIGNAFIRNLAIDIIGEEIYTMSMEEYKSAVMSVWEYLNEIKPYLWREGKTYPENQGALEMLYSNGEIDVTMSYTINNIDKKVKAGVFPKSSEMFLFDKGTVYNNHYLTIPKSSKNKYAALYVINYLLSKEAQLSKQDGEFWGDYTVLDMDKLKDSTKVEPNKNTNTKVLPIKFLEKHRVRELSPEKAHILERDWENRVLDF